ncbi:MAG: methyl-accepting chemotaxis protein [Capsulimonadaceae bacterium]|nr:methyl-accepting chemotaxis protein [Capsulimonadaceae bacterium]
MNWFNNLKFAHKLALSFGLSLFLAMVSGAVALTKMAAVNANNKEMVSGPFAELSTINEARNQMKQVRLGQMRGMLSADQAGKEAGRQISAKAQAEVTTLLADYEKSATQPEDRQNLSELKARWSDYQLLSDQIDRLASGNDFGASAKYMSVVAYPKFTAVVEQVDKMVDWNKAAGANLAARSAEAYASARSLVLLILTVALVVGVLLATWITRMIITSLHAVSRAAESIASASKQLAAGNEDLASRTSEQASNLEETAASMEEMTSVVKQSADNAIHANDVANESKTLAIAGGDVVQNAIEAMRGIDESSKKIADIVSVIDEIAFQTNLLALNAAVEAARVGEQGRGFAVVAAEVRNLAGRSSTAAKEIKSLVQDSVRRVEHGAEQVNKSGDQLRHIVASGEKVAEIVATISAAAQEQSSGIEQVNTAIAQMDEITQKNAALVEEATAASAEMSEQAQELRELVRKFKIEDAEMVTPLLVPRRAERTELANGTTGSAAWQSRAPAKKAPLKIVGGRSPREDMEEF